MLLIRFPFKIISISKQRNKKKSLLSHVHHVQAMGWERKKTKAAVFFALTVKRLQFRFYGWRDGGHISNKMRAPTSIPMPSPFQMSFPGLFSVVILCKAFLGDSHLIFFY